MRVASLLLSVVLVAGTWAQAQDALPKPTPAFKGKIDADRDRSSPDWPQEPHAPVGAPNVVIVLVDDAGFGAASVNGGPAATPNLERLAKGGLRYSSFHVNALCSPTRAALLTGRNNHQVGFGTVTNGYGFPGYNSVWNPHDASVAEILRQNGYSTAAFGKWHNTPFWEVNPVGPFDRWPTGLGFEYFYGFLGGYDNQFEPRLYRNTSPIEPARTPAQGYNLNTDLADDAIHWLHTHDAVAPTKPFFVWFATGATHQPHHVTPEWIAQYHGKFDQGWDKLREETFARQKALGVIPKNAELTARPQELPAWDSLDKDTQKVLSRQAEVYAAYLTQTDHEVGRVLDAIREEGQWDNTLVFYIVGDNGAEAAGGITGKDLTNANGGDEPDMAKRLRAIDDLGSDKYNNLYSGGWAWGMDTPFQWSKQVASHLGGTTDPLILSWPKRIKDAGGVRMQFQHINDVAPTIYAVSGIRFPSSVNGVQQAPLEGSSFEYTFDNAQAPSRHRLQYFEMVGNRGIYKDGWWAGARHLLPWDRTQWDTAPIGQHPWELYHLDEDFSQAHDLAATNPGKLKELVTLFDSEAKRNGAYPLAPHSGPLPAPADGVTSVTYRAGVDRIPVSVAPRFANQHHVLTADIDVPPGGAEGVLIAEGGRWGGFTLYVKSGRVVYESNAAEAQRDRIVSSNLLPSGKVRIEFEYTPGKVLAQDIASGRNVTEGDARLTVNGKLEGQAHFAHFGYLNNYADTLDIGRDLGSPVSNDYEVPFAFTGTLEKIHVELK